MVFCVGWALRRLVVASKIPLRERLLPRLLLSHLSLATIPVLIVGLLLIATARQSIEDTVADGNSEVAKRAANEIQLYVDRADDIVRQSADNMGLLDASPLQRQKMIDNVVVTHEQFRELAVLDLEGKELLSTRLVGAIQQQPRRDIVLPVSQKSTLSHVFIAKDGLPQISITAPVYRLNQVIGYVTAVVNLKDMWDLVDSVQPGADGTRGAGYAYVISAEGRLIAHPERERVYRQEDMRLTEIGAAVSNQRSGFLLYSGAKGEVVAAYAPVEPFGWSVVIEQSTTSAFVRSREMKWEISLLMVASALVAALIGILFAGKIAGPVKSLVRGVILFGQGQLSHSIEAPRSGELTVLANEFNSMALKLREKERQLQQAERLATLSKFAAILSHEIRNPLNSMVINLQILQREIEKPAGSSEKRDKSLQRVLSEVWRMDELVENFLTYARPPELNLTRRDLTQIVEEVVDIQREAARGRSIKLAIRNRAKNRDVLLDVNQIKQVFLNVILNAFDAMEQGGILDIEMENTLSIGAEHPMSRPDDQNQFVTVSFKDTGCGIDSDKLDRIFEVYYTSKPLGTGLGLPIAQQIVEKHGGRIEASSRLQAGSTFTISLPALAVESSLVEPDPPNRTTGTLRRTKSSKAV